MDDAHVTAINRLAAKLEMRQNDEDLVTVRQRRQQLNDRCHSSFTSPVWVLWPPLVLRTCHLLQVE